VLLESPIAWAATAGKSTPPTAGWPCAPYLESVIARVEKHPKIKVLKNAELKTAVGSVGSFVSEVRVNGEERAVTYGVAVVATGGRESRPEEYLYGEDRGS